MLYPTAARARYTRAMRRPLVLLGPQRPEPNLRPALDDRIPGDGPLALVTAGWRNDEPEHAALCEHVGGPTVHLPLYRWFDEVTAAAPDLAAAWSARQNRLRALGRLYRTRLRCALDALFEMDAAREREDAAVVGPQRALALEAVRAIDQQELDHADELRAAVTDLQSPWTHPAVAPFHARVGEALQGARALLVAGGHVGVLVNRLRFFGVPEVLQSAPTVGVAAWSAGVMALTEVVVCFYDDPPDSDASDGRAGPDGAWPEVFDHGLGLVGGLVALPHATQRLRLDDRERVALIACRFAPSAAIGLENGAWIEPRRSGWVNQGRPEAAFRLCADGRLRPLPSAS
jgi:hypothetical protein